MAPSKADSRNLLAYWKALEGPRKLLHITPGFLTLFLYLQRPPTLSSVISPLALALLVVSMSDLIRLRVPAYERLFEKTLGWLMREAEKTSVNGVLWYLIGVIFVLRLYPRDIAVLSILFLSWGDTAASILGRQFGRHGPKLPRNFAFLRFGSGKSLAGLLGASTVCSSVAFVVFGFCNHCMGRGLPEASWKWDQPVTGGYYGLLIVSASCGVGAGIIESLDIKLDDNLTVPILSGAFTWALTRGLTLVSQYIKPGLPSQSN